MLQSTLQPGLLTSEQFDLLPSEEDILFYEEHGWYISPPIIPEAVIDEALLGSERFYRGERDAVLPYATGYSNWVPEDGDGIRNNEFVSLQKKELRQLALHPVIGAIAARLARTSQVRLLDDQLVFKPPHVQESHSTVVGWHADAAYWSTCSSQQLLTAWIPFHDCPVERGPLVVLDGSHKWKDIQDTRFFNNQDLAGVEAQFRDKGYAVVRVPIELKKGQVSFHNCWTIHGSYPNVSNEARIAMAVHLQDKENCYRPFVTADGRSIHMFDETLCRKLENGDPDFSDPDIFPVLWPDS
ncbi:MAG TPA: phytanoyl-CoA dioxygenase family protein [Stenomitos sp.]